MQKIVYLHLCYEQDRALALCSAHHREQTFRVMRGKNIAFAHEKGITNPPNGPFQKCTSVLNQDASNFHMSKVTSQELIKYPLNKNCTAKLHYCCTCNAVTFSYPSTGTQPNVTNGTVQIRRKTFLQQ